MKQYGNLMGKIAKDLSIPQGKTESTDSYMTRIIYSAVGRLMLAALHDHIERDQNAPDMVSIMHLEQKVKALLKAYQKMYPYLPLFSDITALYQSFFHIYSATGNLYHTPYYVSPAAYKTAENKGISFFRGLSLHESICMSGLGIWKPSSQQTDTPESIQEMYCLSEQSLDEYWKMLINRAKWVQSELIDGMQFMETRSFQRGYWTDHPNIDRQISIARVGMQGNEVYYLYRTDGDALYLSQLPAWMTEEKGGQYRFMNSCLHAHRNLPSILVRSDDAIVHLQIGYILPPAENALLQLYSWPESYKTIPNTFARIMCSEVYQAIRPVYEKIGFQFREESL